MRNGALHSAVLEVRLYYEKGWTRDRSARFTFRLNRRRLRAIRARQVREAFGPMIPGLMAPFEIGARPDATPQGAPEAGREAVASS
jgi:hypothetical protein